MSKRSTEELIQMLANAITTGAICGGHHKAERNQHLASEYRETLEVLGVEIPNDKALYDMGKFNGEGSF